MPRPRPEDEVPGLGANRLFALVLLAVAVAGVIAHDTTWARRIDAADVVIEWQGSLSGLVLTVIAALAVTTKLVRPVRRRSQLPLAVLVAGLWIGAAMLTLDYYADLQYAEEARMTGAGALGRALSILGAGVAVLALVWDLLGLRSPRRGAVVRRRSRR